MGVRLRWGRHPASEREVGSTLFREMIQAQLGGSVAAGFEPVREAFAVNFEKHGEVGAACCVHLNGKRVVDLWGGVTAPGGSEPYTADTLQFVRSPTKALVAMAAHMPAQQGQLA